MSPRRWRAVAAAVVIGVLSGCAAIPHQGSVHEVDGDLTKDENAVRYNPPGPPKDATPTQVVYGYLDAMLAFPVRSDVASQYLSDSAAKKWRPKERTVVYSQPRVDADREAGTATQSDENRRQIRLTYTTSATLSARGRYFPQDEQDATVTWDLVREHGQWRISNPPDGVMVSEQYFDDYYLPLSLYYFDESANRLVPDPVYQPEGDQLTTTLTSALLRGPENLLSGEARTFVPDGMRVRVSVPVDEDGVADVRLRGSVGGMSAGDRERMAAQIVWTVRQAHGVSGVRVSVNGNPLDVPGVDEVQSADAWEEFDPGSPQGNSQAFAMRNGRLVVLNGSSVSSFAGPRGEKRSDAVDFRVDPDLERIALVPEGRKSVGVAPLSKSDAPTTVAYGNNILHPVWDVNGRLWVIDRLGRSSSLRVYDGKTGREVPLGPLADTRITSFEMSPDGTRFVAIARPTGRKQAPAQVYVGSIGHSEDGEKVERLAGVRTLELAREGLTSPVAATWRSTVGVVVLASLEGGSRQPYVARIDGSDVSGGPLTSEPLLDDVGAVDVICSGILAAPVYVADKAGRMWVQDVNGRWQKVSSADPLRVPSFPG